MKNKMNRKFKMLFLIILVLVMSTGCSNIISDDFSGSYYVGVAENFEFKVTPKEEHKTMYFKVYYAFGLTADPFSDKIWLVTDGFEEEGSWDDCFAFNSTTPFTVHVRAWGKQIGSGKSVSGNLGIMTYEKSSCIGSVKDKYPTSSFTLTTKPLGNSTQSIQTGVESELLNKIGGINEYCNYDATLHYNQLVSSANMFSKIAYSQVNCATAKYSSSYDNGISFINWVFEKNGESTRLPNTYNEVLTWAKNKTFTADAKGTNIQAGDLVILGNDSTSPIEIVVQVSSNRIKTVGYKTSGNNKVIYETSHSDMLVGKQIIDMEGVAY